jgi:hypothetical protein
MPWQRWWPGRGCPHNRGRVIFLLTAVEQKGIRHDEAEHRRKPATATRPPASPALYSNPSRTST